VSVVNDLRHFVGFRREALDHWWLRLSSAPLVLQATICDCLAFDPFAEEDGLTAAGIEVSRSEIIEALVKGVMVVMVDEGATGRSRSPGGE
jgi:hypothetical protein